MEPEKMIREAAQQADQAELLVEKTESAEIKSVTDKLEFGSGSTSTSYHLRLLHQGRMGTVSFSRPAHFNWALKQAKAISKYSKEYENPSFASKSPTATFQDYHPEHDTPSEISSQLLRLAKKLDRTGIRPVYGSVEFSLERNRLLTSNGTDASARSSAHSASMGVRYKGTSTGEFFSHTKQFDPILLYDKITHNANTMCGGKRITGEHKIMLHPEVVLQFLSTLLSPTIDHYNVHMGESFFAGKRGERVASENISLYDNPLMKSSPVSYAFDEEGTPGRKKPIIKNGVLKGFIRDLRTSWLVKEPPTGNGFHSGSDVSASVSNLVAESNDTMKPEEFSGVMVREILGIHNSNPLTGDFGVQVIAGSLMKKGEHVNPVRKCSLTGNFFKLLKELNLAGGTERYAEYTGPSWVFHGKLV